MRQEPDSCSIGIDCGAGARDCGTKQLALRTGKLTLIGHPTVTAVVHEHNMKKHTLAHEWFYEVWNNNQA